jgi:hypothetical protein
LSGYFTPLTDATTGDLYKGDTTVRNENSPIWRLRNLPVPAMAVYLAAAGDDKAGSNAIRTFVSAARPPLRVTTGSVGQGGHTKAVWSALGPAVFDWMSAQLTAPVEVPA